LCIGGRKSVQVKEAARFSPGQYLPSTNVRVQTFNGS